MINVTAAAPAALTARATSTMRALDTLVERGVIAASDGDVLAAAYRSCEAIRNRLYLVAGDGRDALPSHGSPLLDWLARSLATTPRQLREEYRRATRQSRRVVERLFYDH